MRDANDVGPLYVTRRWFLVLAILFSVLQTLLSRFPNYMRSNLEDEDIKHNGQYFNQRARVE